MNALTLEMSTTSGDKHIDSVHSISHTHTHSLLPVTSNKIYVEVIPSHSYADLRERVVFVTLRNSKSINALHCTKLSSPGVA